MTNFRDISRTPNPDEIRRRGSKPNMDLLAATQNIRVESPAALTIGICPYGAQGIGQALNGHGRASLRMLWPKEPR